MSTTLMASHAKSLPSPMKMISTRWSTAKNQVEVLVKEEKVLVEEEKVLVEEEKVLVEEEKEGDKFSNDFFLTYLYNAKKQKLKPPATTRFTPRITARTASKPEKIS